MRHDYVGALDHDSRTTRTVATRLAGLDAEPGGQRTWQQAFRTDDWIDRRYSDGRGTVVSLFVARSYDYKRLYHHPELSVLRGFDLEERGAIAPTPGAGLQAGRDQGLTVQVLGPPGGDRPGLAAYSLLYNDGPVTNPYVFQLRSAVHMLVARRKPMTLFLAFDAASSPDIPPQNAVVVRALLEAVRSFFSEGRAVLD